MRNFKDIEILLFTKPIQLQFINVRHIEVHKKPHLYIYRIYVCICVAIVGAKVDISVKLSRGNSWVYIKHPWFQTGRTLDSASYNNESYLMQVNLIKLRLSSGEDDIN